MNARLRMASSVPCSTKTLLAHLVNRLVIAEQGRVQFKASKHVFAVAPLPQCPRIGRAGIPVGRTPLAA